MNPLDDIITKRFGELPPNVQQFAGQGSVWSPQVREIAQAQGLNEEQTEGALLEFILVTIGLAHINDYAMEIRERGGLSQETSQALSDGVRALIPADVLVALDEICKKELVADGGVGANISQPTFTDNAPSIHPLAPPPSPTPPTTPSLSPQSGVSSPLVINATQAPAPASMFEEKLKRVFSMPREDSRGISGQSASLGQPPAPSSPPAPQNTPPDPYRESVG